MGGEPVKVRRESDTAAKVATKGTPGRTPAERFHRSGKAVDLLLW